MKRMFWYAEPVGEYEGKARSWTLGSSMSKMLTVRNRSEWTFVGTSGKNLRYMGIWLLPRSTRSRRYMDGWATMCLMQGQTTRAMMDNELISRRTALDLFHNFGL